MGTVRRRRRAGSLRGSAAARSRRFSGCSELVAHPAAERGVGLCSVVRPPPRRPQHMGAQRPEGRAPGDGNWSGIRRRRTRPAPPPCLHHPTKSVPVPVVTWLAAHHRMLPRDRPSGLSPSDSRVVRPSGARNIWAHDGGKDARPAVGGDAPAIVVTQSPQRAARAPGSRTREDPRGRGRVAPIGGVAYCEVGGVYALVSAVRGRIP